MDESNPTCNKRFAKLGIPQTEEARRAYRELIVTTPDLGASISGAILYGGESLAAVGARADRAVARLRADGCRVLLFGHGHFSRVLAARWMGLTTEDARHFLLSTASLSIVGYEHTLGGSAILLWNDDHHANPGA